MTRSLIIAATFATLLSAAPAGARDKGAWRAARPAGDAVSCVPLRQIRETRVRDDSTIDFYMQGGKVYRNTLPDSCPQLGFERRFAYKTSIGQLCSVDIVTVLYSSPPLRGPSCGLGKFQPVTGAPR